MFLGFFWLQMREWKDCTSPTCNAQNRLSNDHYYCSWTLPCLGAIIYCEGVFVCCYPSMVLFELVHQLLQLCAMYPIGSMVLLYMVLHGSHQYTPFMLAYIPAPWILWVLISVFLILTMRKIEPLVGDAQICTPAFRKKWSTYRSTSAFDHLTSCHAHSLFLFGCSCGGSVPGKRRTL